MTGKAITDIDRNVGVRIAMLRKSKGISQTELGNAIGVAFQQIQKYEKGNNRIGASRLREIAKHLDVPMSSLFEDDGEEDTSKTFAMLAETGAIELLKAYATIKDADLRRNVLDIVRTAARLGAGPYAGRA